MRIPRRSLLIACAHSLIATSAHSAIVTYRATGTFTSSDFPSDVSVGDGFSIDFTLDDSAVDTDARSIAGAYPGALQFFEFRLITDSLGTYSGGSTTSKGVIATSDYGGVDRFYLRVDGGTFQPLGGHSFAGLLFVLDDPTQTSSISDPGGSPSLASVLNGSLNLAEFSDTTVRLSAIDKTGTAEGFVTSLIIVPEPNVALLFAVGLVLMGRRRHYRMP